MDLVLDTNILIELERRNKKVEHAIDLMTKEHGDKIFITSPTASEFIYGFLKSKKDKSFLLNILEKYFLLNTSKSSSIMLPQIKYALERKGNTIGLFDLLIASIVIAEGKLLITADTDFSCIQGLNSVVISV